MLLPARLLILKSRFGELFGNFRLKLIEFCRMDGDACGPGDRMLLYGWDRNALPVRFPKGSLPE